MRRFGLLLAVLVLCLPAARAASLAEYLTQVQPGELVPGAERVGAPEGDPPVAPVFAADRQLGHVFLNTDFSDAVGYSSKPIHVLVGIDPDGRVTGSALVEHHEPIVLIGIPERRIREFLTQFVGLDATRPVRGDAYAGIDMVSGATVTVLVINDSITRAARRVARRLGLGDLEPEGVAAAGAERRVDWEQAAEVRDWEVLLAEGAVGRLRLSVTDVNRRFEASGDAEAARRPEPGPPEATFIDLYAGLVSVPSIGRSLLGEREYRNLRERLEPGQHALLVAGRGRYSFKGSGYVRGGIFDRIELVQDAGSVRFHDYQHTRLGEVAAPGAPDFDEVSLFRIPADSEFAAAEPWQLALLVQRATGALSKAFTAFHLDYQLPERYLLPPPAPPATAAQQADTEEAARAALWQRIWRERTASIAVVGLALVALTGLFFFQAALARRPRLLRVVRYGFLTFVLVWLGWWANAQLSVVNVFTLANSVITGFSWSFFLMDPLVFVLWAGVAASLLFWARGPFCGWLCPFGALQELTNHLARRLGVRQIQVPFAVHERLWPIKYLIFLGLFGLSLYDLALAERFAEVEPFKTAIILNFVRDWPYVVYALALLSIGLFIERFFCRYLCPLGAALAIPARIRMFEWLKRWPECGTSCHRCARECPVQSIHPEGHINVNECIYCLHCQELYFCDSRCPHNVTRRLKRERRKALGRRGSAAAATEQANPFDALRAGVGSSGNHPEEETR